MARKIKKRAPGSPKQARFPVGDGLVRRVVGTKPKPKKTVRFDYLKSNLFRVVHADGFHGGLTPGGKVQMAVFSERRPMARSETYKVTADSTLGLLESRVERDALVRELEVSVVMDIDKAIALRGWLDKMLEAVADVQSRANKRKKV